MTNKGWLQQEVAKSPKDLIISLIETRLLI